MNSVYLYKYRPLDRRALKLVKSHELYFSTPLAFNDPFDSDLDAMLRGSTEDLYALF